MVAAFDAHQACKKFSELEFFNSHLMSVGVTNNKLEYELIVYLFRKIRTDNLPREFEGFKVNYTFQGKF